MWKDFKNEKPKNRDKILYQSGDSHLEAGEIEEYVDGLGIWLGRDCDMIPKKGKWCYLKDFIEANKWIMRTK